jgi:hypothetical protein
MGVQLGAKIQVRIESVALAGLAQCEVRRQALQDLRYGGGDARDVDAALDVLRHRVPGRVRVVPFQEHVRHILGRRRRHVGVVGLQRARAHHPRAHPHGADHIECVIRRRLPQ